MTEKNRLRGKRSRAQGAAFERRVRQDLEEKGWIVSKWPNNVEFGVQNKDIVTTINENVKAINSEWGGKLVPAKAKFRGIGIPMALGTGFPDFIAFKRLSFMNESKKLGIDYGWAYEVIGVESKMNGYLDPKEREKCKWLLENNIFSKILIASKTKVKNRIVVEYKEFK